MNADIIISTSTIAQPAITYGNTATPTVIHCTLSRGYHLAANPTQTLINNQPTHTLITTNTPTQLEVHTAQTTHTYITTRHVTVAVHPPTHLDTVHIHPNQTTTGVTGG